jgi:hypothetical protein
MPEENSVESDLQSTIEPFLKSLGSKFLPFRTAGHTRVYVKKWPGPGPLAKIDWATDDQRSRTRVSTVAYQQQPLTTLPGLNIQSRSTMHNRDFEQKNTNSPPRSLVSASPAQTENRVFGCLGQSGRTCCHR